MLKLAVQRTQEEFVVPFSLVWNGKRAARAGDQSRGWQESCLGREQLLKQGLDGTDLVLAAFPRESACLSSIPELERALGWL